MSTANQEQSFLNLSDEEMMNAVPPEAVVPEQEEVVDEEVPESETNEENADGVQGQGQESSEEVAEESETSEEEEESTGEDEATPTGEAKSDAGKKPETNEQPKEESTETVDYKAQYEELLKPFKANGREMTVKTVEDARTLMQMGANYNKKMAALKPNLKILKMLENNGLLDEGKLSYLIDLDKKNPEAINKLMKDSGLDPLDLDAEKAAAYKPSTYTVDEREVELDAVLEEIQDTSTYNRTLDIVGSKWDGPSKRVIADTPQILKVINSHVQSGIYDLIHQEIENERTFGRLQGLSDIEAYRQVGDRMHAQGRFNHLTGSSPQTNNTPSTPVVVTPKPKMGNEDKLREKKRAASAAKPAAIPAATPADFNPLSLSDEEFSKLGDTKFL